MIAERLGALETHLVAKAIFVITARSGAQAAGMTAAWVTRVSGTPAMMAVAVHRGSRTAEVVEESRGYVINALGAEQAELAKRFGGASSRSVDKFAGLEVTESAQGVILAGTLGHLACRLVEVLPIGDHRLLIGEIVTGAQRRDAPPLLYTASLEETNGG
jgi:flavin reductase